MGVPSFGAGALGLSPTHRKYPLDIFCEVEYKSSMKQMLTAKLKLHTTPEQFAPLRRTQLAYRDALNYVSQYSFAHGKKSNQQWLQRETYDEIRLRFHLPSQMACNVPRQVGATYKGLWTKVKQNAQARQAGRTQKRYKGLDEAPKYVSPTLTYNYKYDYSVGDDVGIRYLAVTSDTRGESTFHSGKSRVAKANHSARLTQRPQKNGTRSATRRLVVMSGRERRGTAGRQSCRE